MAYNTVVLNLFAEGIDPNPALRLR